MNALRTAPGRALGTALLAAVAGGALLGNLLGGEVLDLSETWRTVLWLLGAFVAGGLTWSVREDTAPQASVRTRVSLGIVVLLAISSVVLLGSPAGYYAASAVALVGLAVLLTTRHS